MNAKRRQAAAAMVLAAGIPAIVSMAQQSTHYTDPGLPGESSPSAQLQFRTDPFTGTFHYSLPVALPPARNGTEPNVALAYSSRSGNGWLGVGWSLETGSIERDTSHGVPVTWVPEPAGSQPKAKARYDDAYGFVARVNGRADKLVLVGTMGSIETYRSELDRDFTRFERNLTTNSWTAIDRSGKRYDFGTSGLHRLQHPSGQSNWISTTDPDYQQLTTFGWYLARIVDTNGNEVLFKWSNLTFENQLYLRSIWYNGRGTSVGDFTHFVNFNLEKVPFTSTLIKRPDAFSDCRSGMCRRTNYRLDNVEVFINRPSGGTLRVRRYQMGYELSPSTGKSRLISVTQQGSDYDTGSPTSLPPVTFVYHDGEGWGSSPAFDGDDQTLTWTGLDEKAGGTVPAADQPSLTAVKGRDFVGHHGPSSDGGGWPAVRAGFYHMNGDALLDRVMRRGCNPGTCSGDFIIQMQNPLDVDPAGFVTGGSLDFGVNRHADAQAHDDDSRYNSLQYYKAETGNIRSTLIDLDGDGVLDKAEQYDPGPYTKLCVDFDWPSVDFPFTICGHGVTNIENDFPNSETFGSPYSSRHVTGFSATVIRAGLYDMNGDRRPDWVRLAVDPATPPGNYPDALILDSGGDYYDGHAYYYVQLNTGVRQAAMFAPSVEWFGVDGDKIGAQFMGNPEDEDEWFHLSGTGDDNSGADIHSFVSFMDMNGDGLTDRIMREPYPDSASASDETFDDSAYDAFGVQLNNGTGFEPVEWWRYDDFDGPNPNWVSPVGRRSNGTTVTTVQDVTGDGLPDRVTVDNPWGPPFEVFQVQGNTGSGFAAPVAWPINSQGKPNDVRWTSITYTASTSGSRNTWVDLIDIDGDGLKDRVMIPEGGSPDPDNPIFKVELCKGPLPDMMTQVNSGLDGQVLVKYRSAAHFDNVNPATGDSMLPVPMYVVSETVAIDAHDELSIQVVTYDYQGGWYDRTEREFRGFHRVTQDFIPADGELGAVPNTRLVTWFHQGGGIQDPDGGEWQDLYDAQTGIPYRIETYQVDESTGAETLLTRRVNRVEVTGFNDSGDGPQRWFARITKAITEDFNGLAPALGRAVAVTYVHDDTGDQATLNILREHRHGEVRVDHADLANHTTFEDAGTLGDEMTTVFQYAPLAPDIRDRRAVVKVCPGATATDCTLAECLGWTESTFDPDTGNLATRTRRGDGIAETDTFEHDGVYGNVIRHVDAAGCLTTLEYNHSGEGYHIFPERTVSDASQGAGTYAELDVTRRYDPATGQVLEATSPTGVVTTYEYDRLHRLDAVRLDPPDGPPVDLQEREYSVLGIVADADNSDRPYSNFTRIRESDGRGEGGFRERWTFHDGRGRTIQTWDELDRIGEDQRAWQVSDIRYDGRGRVRYRSEGRLVVLAGEPVYQEELFSVGATTSYDALGRTTLVEPPPGDPLKSPTAPVQVAYHDGADPWAVVTTDARDHSRTMYHDAYGRLVRIKDEMGETTHYGYDPLGRITSIMDPHGNPTTFEYDKLGRKRVAVDPDSGRWEFEYDEAGRLESQTDELGNRTEFDYDRMNRLTVRRAYRAPDGTFEEKTQFFYDSNAGFSDYDVYRGQLFAVVKRDPATNEVRSAVSNSYDRRGRVRRSDTFLEKNETTYSIGYDYNDVNAVTRITYPQGLVIDLAYTTDQTLHKVESTTGTGPRTVFYEAKQFDHYNRPIRFELADGAMQTETSFHASSQRVDRILTTTQPSGMTLVDVQHTWDEAGNLLGIVDDVDRLGSDPAYLDLGLDTLVYDPLNRLKRYRHTHTGTTLRFAYDEIGNVLRNDETGFGAGPEEAYRYESMQPAPDGPPRHQAHAATFANNRAYVYDANGNMTSRQTARPEVIGLVTQTLAYNACNQLVGVTDTEGLDVSYGYGPDDLRLWKQDANTGKLVVWISNLFEHRNGRFINHVHAGGRRVATVQQRAKKVRLADVSGPQEFGTGGAAFTNKTSYLHLNHMLSPVVITDEAGTIQRQIGYMAFGQTFEHVTQAGAEIDNLYTGQVLDRDTGLYYYGARYYDPELARFIQPDPIVPDAVDPQALNRYSYVLNNPLRYTDPSGQGYLTVLAFIVKYAVEAVIVEYALTFLQAAIQVASGQDLTAFDEFGKRLVKSAVQGAILGAATGALGELAGWDGLGDLVQAGLSAPKYDDSGQLLQAAGFLNSVISRVAVVAVYHEDREKDLKFAALSSSLNWLGARGVDNMVENEETTAVGAFIGSAFANGFVEGLNSIIYLEIYEPGEYGADNGASFMNGFYNGAVAGGLSAVSQFPESGSGFASVGTGTFFLDVDQGFNFNLGARLFSAVAQALQADRYELIEAPNVSENEGNGDGNGD